MKRTILVFGLIFVFVFASLESQEGRKKKLPARKKQLPTKTVKKSAKKAMPEFSGKIISLNDLIMVDNGDVTPEKAAELANSGQPLVFMNTDGRVYFLYDKDGKFMSKELAEYAGKNVSVTGTDEIVDGIIILTVKKIVTVDA